MPHSARIAAAIGLVLAAILGAVPAHSASAPSTQLFVPNLVQSGVPTTLVAEVAPRPAG